MEVEAKVISRPPVERRVVLALTPTLGGNMMSQEAIHAGSLLHARSRRGAQTPPRLANASGGITPRVLRSLHYCGLVRPHHPPSDGENCNDFCQAPKKKGPKPQNTDSMSTELRAHTTLQQQPLGVLQEQSLIMLRAWDSALCLEHCCAQWLSACKLHRL